MNPSHHDAALRLIAAGLAPIVFAATVAAQTVYESQGKSGPVFSDQPSPGAKPITVGPTNVVPSTPPPAAQPDTPAPPPSYRSLAVAEPENEGTIHSNTGAFEVRVRSSPGLRSSAGDRLRLVLDGNLLPGSYGSSRIRLTESDWQSAAGGGGVEHTLQAAIVDKTGRLLIESPPVTFYVHRAAVGGRRGR